jgi:hypothetical protein
MPILNRLVIKDFVKKVVERVEKSYLEFINIGLYKSHFNF